MKRLFLGLVTLGFLAVVGCAAPAAEEDTGTGAGAALEQDETESTSIVSDVASTTDGVDTWRLSYVIKTGVAEPFPVAIGTKKGVEVIDVIFGLDANGNNSVRIATKMEVTKDLAASIATDMGAVYAKAYPELPAMKTSADTNDTDETSTASLHVLTTPSKTDPCAKQLMAARIQGGALILSTTGAILACGVSFGALCAVGAVTSFAAAKVQITASDRLKACRAANQSR